MGKEVFLVTGASGCIGSWVLKHLIKDGVPVIATDLVEDYSRHEVVLSEDEIRKVHFSKLDVTDFEETRKIVENNEVTHIVHLAGLMTPACKSDPILGANVNILGTIGIFEAARKTGGQIRGISYASSIAALGPPDYYKTFPLKDSANTHPDTLYGVYKVANEEIARIYWQDWNVGSIGLRPYIVYGPGRDQGLTSSITLAIMAAVMGRSYHIGFGGSVGLIYADDVARIFIESARREYQGSATCNLLNEVLDVKDFVKMLKSEIPLSDISFSEKEELPFSAETSDEGLRQIIKIVPHTSLINGVRDSIDKFKELLKGGHAYLEKVEKEHFEKE